MPLNNYRDLGYGSSDVNAGFQFEFYCAQCKHTWTSDFKPYRRGQFSALLAMFGWLVMRNATTATRTSTTMATMGARGAKESALEDARAIAGTMFRECPGCDEVICNEHCWDENEQLCEKCVAKARNPQAAAALGGQAAAAQAGPACPNCGTGCGGGRFCPECGFDMASTHKTCPACGTMQLRQARFCTDCGHSF